MRTIVKISNKNLITEASNNTDNIRTNRRATKSRKPKWEEKQLYRIFGNQRTNKDYPDYSISETNLNRHGELKKHSYSDSDECLLANSDTNNSLRI